MRALPLLSALLLWCAGATLPEHQGGVGMGQLLGSASPTPTVATATGLFGTAPGEGGHALGLMKFRVASGLPPGSALEADGGAPANGGGAHENVENVDAQHLHCLAGCTGDKEPAKCKALCNDLKSMK